MSRVKLLQNPIPNNCSTPAISDNHKTTQLNEGFCKKALLHDRNFNNIANINRGNTWRSLTSFDMTRIYERKELLGATTMFPTARFKNHHLFIQNNKAELTLNLNGLNSNDQKQLIECIAISLKQKKLMLSQLIINGVPR